MQEINPHSPNVSNNRLGKYTSLETQEKTIFTYLQNHIATASMVSQATGIPQKCICRYKRDFELQGLLFEVERKFCVVTGFRAWYLTTNPNLLKSNLKNSNNG